MLKARKQKGNLNVSQTFDKTRVGNKRYMILTYVVEFDKVHYPLPLNFEVRWLSPAHLKRFFIGKS